MNNHIPYQAMKWSFDPAPSRLNSYQQLDETDTYIRYGYIQQNWKHMLIRVKKCFGINQMGLLIKLRKHKVKIQVS